MKPDAMILTETIGEQLPKVTPNGGLMLEIEAYGLREATKSACHG
jgi:hypothetical protein